MKHEDGMHDAALLLARSVLGASIAAHGAQKLFGWFGGPGPENASKMFGSLGFQPAGTMARVASMTEIGSGVMIATGAGGPLGPMMLMSVMAVAAGSVHFKNGYFQSNQGFELNTMYALVALLLAVEDHGRFSVDEVTGMRSKSTPPNQPAGSDTTAATVTTVVFTSMVGNLLRGPRRHAHGRRRARRM